MNYLNFLQQTQRSMQHNCQNEALFWCFVTKNWIKKIFVRYHPSLIQLYGGKTDHRLESAGAGVGSPEVGHCLVEAGELVPEHLLHHLLVTVLKYKQMMK